MVRPTGLKHIFAAGLFVIAGLAHGADVIDMRLWNAPDNTRVVLDLTGDVRYDLFELSNPQRLVIDFEQATLKKNISDINLKGSPFSNIRAAKRNQGLRLVFDLVEQRDAKVFLLKKTATTYNRLVMDLPGDAIATLAKATNPSVPKKSSTRLPPSDNRQKASQPSSARPIIIAVDAGHGGEDPGALGPKKKLLEKHVVLAIAKKLATKINAQPGYKAVLIRTGDYYLGLKKRRELARQHKADLFVSIHADAFTNPQAHGSSVYALSSSGASSTTAKFLAEKENESDVIGGVDLTDKDKLLSSVLVDLSMTHKQEASEYVGKHVIGYIGKLNRLHSKRVEKAAFAVLKAPDVPSILIETGFISNPDESKRLASKSYQAKMAKAIFSGIRDYFQDDPPEGTYVHWLKQQTHQKTTIHIVKSGDTLSEIAMRYNVSSDHIKMSNALQSAKIYVGQRLTISH